MNIKELREILVSNYLTTEEKKIEIIKSLAKDENVIIDIIQILNSERDQKKKLLIEMNLLLSKADVGLDDPIHNEHNFIQREIYSFYKKHENIIGHCFKNLIL